MRVHSQSCDIDTPTTPVCLPRLGSRRHSSREVICIRNTEIILVEIFEETWYTVQKRWFGKGEFELAPYAMGQSARLSNGCESATDRPSSDLVPAMIEVTLLDHRCKTCEASYALPEFGSL